MGLGKAQGLLGGEIIRSPVSWVGNKTALLPYNSLGRMTHETWYLNDTEKARYIYTYNGEGNIVRSIDKYALKEYNYVYEGGKVIHSTEYSVSLNGNEIVTEKILLNTVRYFYTKEEQLERKLIEDCDGNFFEYHYEYPENGEPIVCCKVNGQIIRAQSESDHLGRKVFDELQLGKANLFRKFSYTDGAATQKHLDAGAVLSKPTTTLISKMEFADGRTIEYEYDGEERITKVIDSFDGITEYEYDALGQLKTETVNGTVVNNMTYDNYGNITEKNGVVYQYGNAVWKDLLTQVGTGANSTIAYDANGNPTTYLGHTLTWEKGRQLKKFDNIEYTYNANGIRTGKKINGVLHTYTLDGTKILRETWGENTLVPLYDNGDSICGILYNSVPYYFIKNLQGDVIAITNANGVTVAQYTYDAWGVPTIKEDTSDCNIATVNPFRYRGYYYDAETKFYYLQSRYYDASVGRFVNSDESTNIGLGDNLRSFDLYTYTENNPVSMIDEAGYAAINVICAAIGAVVGWFFGDWIAKKLGYLNGWKYWAIRAGVIVGGAVIGWFAGTAITKLIALYLKNNPRMVFKLYDKLGAKALKSAMEFLGINPFTLAMDGSKFIAFARLFNTPLVTLSYNWVVKLYELAKKFGYKIILDVPHKKYSWHIHFSGKNGKINDLHIQIVKEAWDWLKQVLD